MRPALQLLAVAGCQLDQAFLPSFELLDLLDSSAVRRTEAEHRLSWLTNTIRELPQNSLWQLHRVGVLRRTYAASMWLFGRPGTRAHGAIGRPLGVIPDFDPARRNSRRGGRWRIRGGLAASTICRGCGRRPLVKTFPTVCREPGAPDRSKRSQPFAVGAPARPPVLPSFDVAPGAPARPPAWPGAAVVPELAAPLDAAPPAPPAPPPCVRAGCDAHVMRATSNMESFFVAMIRSLRLERTTHLGSIRFPTLAGVPRPRLSAHSSPPGPRRPTGSPSLIQNRPFFPTHPGAETVLRWVNLLPAHVDVAAEGAAMNGIVDPVENDPSGQMASPDASVSRNSPPAAP